ncbi:MAG: flagellar basal-body MS-ring/collar protein FliF [bacterium]
MRERVNTIVKSVRDFWGRLNRRQQIITLLGAAAVAVTLLAAVVFVLTRAAGPRYGVLFTELDTEDASAIIGRLGDARTPYKLMDEGRTILVPEKQVLERRMDMASAGLPAKGVAGYELFDRTRLGITDFTQQVNYQRALEGELARTIMGLEEVESARVSVVMPEDTLFITEKEPSTASVALKLRKNKELTEEQIRGIIHLVAHSVKGLEPKNITVVDSHANLLSEMLTKKKDMREKMELTEFQLKMKERIEETYSRKIQKALTKVLGEENAVVVVTAELDFDVHTTTNEVFEPVVGDKGIVRSEQEIEEKYLGTGTVPEIGVPGTTSNIPGYKGLAEGTAEYLRSEATRNYEITKKVDEIQRNPGDIRRLSVAVMLNEEISDDLEITRRKLAEIRENVVAAANLDFVRGDKVSVISIKFTPRPTLADRQRQQEEFQRRMKYIYMGLLALSLLMIVILSIIAIRRSVVPEEKPPEIPEPEEERLEEPVPVEELLVPELTDEQRMREKIREEVLRMISDDPEGAALIVRSWLFE